MGRCKISPVLITDDLVLLASTESGLQYSLIDFAASCNIAGMKISTFKTEVLHLLKNFVQSFLQDGGVSLKQVEQYKSIEVTFMSDRRQDKELDV